MVSTHLPKEKSTIRAPRLLLHMQFCLPELVQERLRFCTTQKTTMGMATRLWIWSCSQIRLQVCGCFAFMFFPPSAPSTLSLKSAFAVQCQN